MLLTPNCWRALSHGKQTTTKDAFALSQWSISEAVVCWRTGSFIQKMRLVIVQIGFLGLWLLFKRKIRVIKKRLLTLWMHFHLLHLWLSHIHTAAKDTALCKSSRLMQRRGQVCTDNPAGLQQVLSQEHRCTGAATSDCSRTAPFS